MLIVIDVELSSAKYSSGDVEVPCFYPPDHSTLSHDLDAGSFTVQDKAQLRVVDAAERIRQVVLAGWKGPHVDSGMGRMQLDPEKLSSFIQVDTLLKEM